MRRIAQRLIPTLALGVLALVGCKSKKAQLEDIQLFNGQIRSFSLSSEDKDAKAALERVVFSIRHQEPGLITNPDPLPYAQPLKKVTLSITPVATSGTVVEVAVGTNGTFEEWKKGKVYDLSSGVSDLMVRIRNKETNPRLGDGNQYTYRVHLEKYANDPQTFAWKTISGVSGLPSISSALATLITVGTQRYCYYVTPSGTNDVRYFAGSPVSWTAGSLSGIPSGERLSSVASLSGTLFATTSAGKLYSLSGSSWTAVSGVSATRILGTVPRGERAERLALLTPKGSGYAFATYTPAEGLRMGHDVPATFPITGGYSFAEGGIDYVGSRLYLVGGRTADNKVVTSQWITTNGTDWGQEATDIKLTETLISESIVQEAGTSRLYRFATTSTGLVVYFSSDKGAHWETGRAVALAGLTPSDFASSPIFAFQGSDTKKIYLIRTTSAGVSTLYEGTIRREEHH
jgi:hypothetical protein